MSYIFLHGLGQNLSSWDKTIGFMKNSNDNTCLEIFSFNESKEITYQNLYNAFCDYCDKMSSPLNLCGLSLGGVLALNYAIDYPKKVKKLVLIAPQYKTPKMLMKFQNIIFRLMPENSFKEMGLKKNDVIGLMHSMLDLDFTEKLENISCKTLLVCGENDKANQKAARELSEMIEGAVLKEIKNTGHEVNVEAPKELAIILDDF